MNPIAIPVRLRLRHPLASVSNVRTTATVRPLPATLEVLQRLSARAPEMSAEEAQRVTRWLYLVERDEIRRGAEIARECLARGM